MHNKSTQALRFIGILVLLPVLAFAQYENIRFEDYNYKKNIKTVTLHIGGLPLSQPIIELGSNTYLEFSFDDLDADAKNYSYRIIQCNQDWTPTDLTYFEYIDGFEEESLRDFDYSFNTFVPYTHYWLSLPNRDMAWTKSGNYLLVVYENEEERTPVISRRFVVVEPVCHIEAWVSLPSKVSKNRTHQEIDFRVLHQGFDIRNARMSVSATVLQNGNWQSAIDQLPPFYVRNDQVLEWDYQDKIVFPAGKEFRFVDLRSLRYPSSDVADVDRFDDGYYVTLLRDRKRAKEPFLTVTDLNGGFVVENRDRQNVDLESEYANTHFRLYSPTEYPDADVYIVGAITTWKLLDEFKMAYSEQDDSYVATIPLKQGYYDYVYAIATPDKESVDFSITEGNWYETENEYLILIYYRPFGARYDQVIGAYTFSSRN